MELNGSLPHSQVPATCPYLEPDQSVHALHPIYWRSILILSFLLRLTCSLLGPYILFNTVFLNNLSLRLSLNVSDQF
jgi:hypothetical protein